MYEACQHVHVGMHDSLKTIFSKTTTKTQHQVQSRLLLDVVVRKGAAVLELLACEDEALLVRGDPLLILNFLLHVLNGVTRLYIEGDCFAREGLHEDLHI